jgi:hypothetical protein
MTVHKVNLDRHYTWFTQTSGIKSGDILLYESRDANGYFTIKYIYIALGESWIENNIISVNLLTSENKLIKVKIPINNDSSGW